MDNPDQPSFVGTVVKQSQNCAIATQGQTASLGQMGTAKMIDKNVGISDGNFERLRFSSREFARHLETTSTHEAFVDHMTQTSPSDHSFASLFLSDMHLGARACRDEALLTFLQAHHAKRIYLVGDIFDTWHAIGAHWSANQHAIIALLLTRAQNGVEIVYTPGNHDAFFRPYIGTRIGNIAVANHVLHVGANGKRYLVTHGDSVDIFAGRFPMLSRLAAKAENGLRGFGNALQHVLRRFDLPIGDQVDWLILKVNNLIRAQDDFQSRLADLARKHGADGIICGHFHQPALHDDLGVTYANCGDWVENATALAEDHTGALVQLHGVITSRKVSYAQADPQVLMGELK